MDYQAYERAKTGLKSTVAFIKSHQKLGPHVFGVDADGDGPFDMENDLRRYMLGNRLETLTADFDLEPFAAVLFKYWNEVRDYRQLSRRKNDWLADTFLGRWESKLRVEARTLGHWRDKITVTLQFGESHLRTTEESEINWHGAGTLGPIPFSVTKEGWSGQFKLHIAIGGNYFTKVKALFEGEPLIERVSTRSDGSHAYQYLVAQLDETVTETNGEPMAHGIRAIKFHGFETYGRSGDRKIEPVTRWLALADKTVTEDTIIGTATTAAKAYALVKSRIARDMMARL